MQVEEIMTMNPAVCMPTTSLRKVARMMIEHDCGAIPVVENERTRKLVGIVTDRDIACRTVALDKNPLEMRAGEILSKPVVTVRPEESVEDCCRVMEENQVRRVPVVDENGCCCGIVAQADIAREESEEIAGEVVKEVSRPSETPSLVGGAEPA